MFHEVSIPGKGQGLVATAKLPVGTILITEPPLITTDDDRETAVEKLKEIARQFSLLSPEQKIQILSLHDPGSLGFVLDFALMEISNFATEEVGKAVRIFCGNAISLCNHKEMGINKSGLYPTISRINHSCVPNVVWSWIQSDTKRAIKQVRVIREICEGDEILASYCEATDSFPTKVERQRLLERWRFICKCDICSLTGEELEENDNTRKKITKFDDDVVAMAGLGLIDQSLDAAKQKLKIMKSIKKEMIVKIPSALMECCEMSAHCKRYKQMNSAALMEKAKEMSSMFGDCFLYNYQKTEKKIQRVLK